MKTKEIIEIGNIVRKKVAKRYGNVQNWTIIQFAVSEALSLAEKKCQDEFIKKLKFKPKSEFFKEYENKISNLEKENKKIIDENAELRLDIIHKEDCIIEPLNKEVEKMLSKIVVFEDVTIPEYKRRFEISEKEKERAVKWIRKYAYDRYGSTELLKELSKKEDLPTPSQLKVKSNRTHE